MKGLVAAARGHGPVIMRNEPLALADDEVRAYFLEVQEVGQDDRLERYERLLDAEERARRERFVFERDRRLFVMAHGLTREALSEQAEVAPEKWRFVAGKNGRPEIAAPRLPRPLRFNLSHTAGLVACALTWSRDVGVDVERRDRPGTDLAVADRYFSPPEVRWLYEAAERERPDRFLILWTLKEAYIKAVGEGLSAPLDRFAVATAGTGPAPATIAFMPPLADEPEAWRLEWSPIGGAHFAAVAVRRGAGGPIRITWRIVDP